MESPLKTLRKKLGITQPQLARLAGVSQSQISEVENGMIEIRGKLLSYLQNTGKDILNIKDQQKEFMSYVAAKLQTDVEPKLALAVEQMNKPA